MTDNIIPFTGLTTVDIEPNKVLEGAKDQDLETVILIGVRKDNSFYFAGSTSDVPIINLLLDHAKKDLFDNSTMFL